MVLPNSNSSQERTLRIKPSFFYTMSFVIVLSVILAFVVEFMCRSDFASATLPSPIIASGHHQLDIKLELLDRLIKKKGKVDCIFIGASMMNAGIYPQQFVTEFEALTRKKIVCFNLGLKGFRPNQAAVLIKIIAKKYKPSLIIWGISPFSFLTKPSKKYIFSENIWSRYWLDDFNLKGWVIEHSYAYRYFLRFFVWIEQQQYSIKLGNFERNAGELGSKKIRSNDVASLSSNMKHVKKLSKGIKKFNKSNVMFSFLDQVTQLHSQVEIMIVEIPVHRSNLDSRASTAENYSKAVVHISKLTKKNGVLFIPTNHLKLIPDNGWRDSNHMNPLGAQTFSPWLGRHVGLAFKAGLISLEK